MKIARFESIHLEYNRKEQKADFYCGASRYFSASRNMGRRLTFTYLCLLWSENGSWSCAHSLQRVLVVFAFRWLSFIGYAYLRCVLDSVRCLVCVFNLIFVLFQVIVYALWLVRKGVRGMLCLDLRKLLVVNSRLCFFEGKYFRRRVYGISWNCVNSTKSCIYLSICGNMCFMRICN